MASTYKTPRYGLSQWVGGDKPTMDDFNADNRKAEAAIGSIADSVHEPIIRDGNWHVWDITAAAYVDTGIAAQGRGVKILGTYATLEDLEAAVTAPAPGDMYNIGTAAPYEVYLWDSVAGTWADQGTIQGERGPGIPEGGTAGQVLIKQSGTDYDVTWGNGGGGSDASITAYTVTLAAGGWAEREGGGYEQTVPIATATALDTCEITAKPRDGLKAWAYDLWPTAQGPGTVTFGALYLPAEDMVYDLTVVNADRVYVNTVETAIAAHNTDAGAHGNITLDITGGDA